MCINHKLTCSIFTNHELLWFWVVSQFPNVSKIPQTFSVRLAISSDDKNFAKEVVVKVFPEPDIPVMTIHCVLFFTLRASIALFPVIFDNDNMTMQSRLNFNFSIFYQYKKYVVEVDADSFGIVSLFRSNILVEVRED